MKRKYKSFWDLNPWNLPHLLDIDDDFAESRNSGLSVYKEDEAICVEASLPGVTEDDIDVTLDHDILRIEAEQKEEEKDEKRHYYRRGRRSYLYRVVLPEHVDEKASIETSFQGGILTLKFKRSGPPTHKKIQIKKRQ